MREPVLSTYKILKEKAFNSDITESWIDWAIGIMEAGYESINLYELAGITRPYNQFELKELTNKVFKDLNLDYSGKTKTLKNYVYFLLTSNIDKPEKYDKVLREFRDIYYELYMDSEYQDLALLCWAKDDLLYTDYQHYWEGVCVMLGNSKQLDELVKETPDNQINLELKKNILAMRTLNRTELINRMTSNKYSR